MFIRSSDSYYYINLTFIIFFHKENFQKERSLLIQEINSLKSQKVELEHLLVSKNVEVSKLKENLDKHHLNMEKSNFNMTKSESQVVSFFCLKCFCYSIYVVEIN